MGAREQFKQTGHVFAVEIEKIIPDPNQPRQSGGFDEDSIAILANDIALRGQDTPIEGRLLPDGTFMLNSGERR